MVKLSLTTRGTVIIPHIRRWPTFGISPENIPALVIPRGMKLGIGLTEILAIAHARHSPTETKMRNFLPPGN